MAIVGTTGTETTPLELFIRLHHAARRHGPATVFRFGYNRVSSSLIIAQTFTVSPYSTVSVC